MKLVSIEVQWKKPFVRTRVNNQKPKFPQKKPPQTTTTKTPQNQNKPKNTNQTTTTTIQTTANYLTFQLFLYTRKCL
jgi:hypothetical protein